MNRVSIRLALYVGDLPAGARLERQVPLPTYTFNFDNTPEGLSAAQVAAENLENYLTKYHAVPKKTAKEASP